MLHFTNTLDTMELKRWVSKLLKIFVYISFSTSNMIVVLVLFVVQMVFLRKLSRFLERLTYLIQALFNYQYAFFAG